MENSAKWSNAKVQALLNLYTTEEIQHDSDESSEEWYTLQAETL